MGGESNGRGISILGSELRAIKGGGNRGEGGGRGFGLGTKGMESVGVFIVEVSSLAGLGYKEGFCLKGNWVSSKRTCPLKITFPMGVRHL